MKPPASSHRDGTRAHQLTVPTNQVSLISGKVGNATVSKNLGLEHMSPNGFQENLTLFQTELQNQRGKPARYWIQRADSLKRQADKSSEKGDLESQYLCILAQFLPYDHPGFQKMSLESQARIRKNAETILNLLSDTRAALKHTPSNYAKQISSKPAHNSELHDLNDGLPEPSCASKTPSSRGIPARSSLRAPEHSSSSNKKASRSSTPKRVSFADKDQISCPPSPTLSDSRSPLNIAQVTDAPVGGTLHSDSRDKSFQKPVPSIHHTPSKQRPSPWWSPRKHSDRSRAAQLTHPSQCALTLSAPAEGPLCLAPSQPFPIQSEPSKAKKRNGWQLPDWFSRANPSTSQPTEATAPPLYNDLQRNKTQNPESPAKVFPQNSQNQSVAQTQAPSTWRAPQLSPLRLPNTSLLVDVHDPPTARDSKKTAPLAAHAPNRLTGPSEKSLIANAGKHERSDGQSPRPSSRRGSSSITEPELANFKKEVNMDISQVISKHMTPHQQEQGFVPISKTSYQSREVLDEDLETDVLAVVSPTPPTSSSNTSSPTKALASRPSRWNLFSRSRDNSIPRVNLPGAEELDVLSSTPIENEFAKQSASTSVAESGKPLRRLHIPASLVPRFLECAKANTLADCETCGLLLGKEQNDRLYVTDLVLPPQTGNSDSCTAISEEETTALQIKENLLTLGWIHTHPSQSCFLSSLDLHTHAGYQALLPEAVAVVCAPKHRPRLGVFRLTDPPGLRYVLNCKQTAAFHAHVTTGKNKDLPLYTDAISSHVRLDNAKSSPTIRVRDLR